MTARYKDETVARVRDASDIVQVVSEYVQLKKVGNRFVGLCPFHSERTPSFSVSKDRQLFYCFGCHAGGNVFSFVMRIEGLTFPEAVERLAARAGLDISSDLETEENRAARERRQRAFEANQLAMAYYCHVLNRSTSAQARAARDYLLGRGIDRAVAERFNIGLTPAGWDGLVKALSAKGISRETLVECGLALVDDGSGRIFDRFRNRVMFPIINVWGRVIGFGGRSYDGTNPKYLNSPESLVFSKRRNLYGLNLAADSIKSSGRAILVEGYIDVVSLMKAGVPNVVATLGTALTVEQARLIARYASELVLFYDGDDAGFAATAKAVEVAQSVGLAVRVAPLPGGHDPDSFARQEGPEAVKALLDDAEPFASYRIRRILQGTDLSSIESRVKAADQVAETLASVSDDVERAEYLREVCEKLGVDPQVLSAAVRRLVAAARDRQRVPSVRLKREAFRPVDSSPLASKAYFEVERWLLLLALTDAEAAARIADAVGENPLSTSPNAKLMDIVLQARSEGKHIDAASLVDAAGPELAGYVSELVGSEDAFDLDEGAVDRALDLLRRRRMQVRLAEIDAEIKQAESAGAVERIKALLKEQVELRQALGRDIALY